MGRPGVVTFAVAATYCEMRSKIRARSATEAQCAPFHRGDGRADISIGRRTRQCAPFSCADPLIASFNAAEIRHQTIDSVRINTDESRKQHQADKRNHVHDATPRPHRTWAGR
jgi:hypothetical protein